MLDRIYFATQTTYERNPNIASVPTLHETESAALAHIERVRENLNDHLPGVVREMYGALTLRMFRVRVTELDEDESAYNDHSPLE